MNYVKMTSEQAKVLTDATQIFEALEQHRKHDGRFRGSMHWKHINNRDYLYRGFSGGRSQSLGPRSHETEEIKQRFDAGRSEHKQRSKALAEQARIHAGYIKVNRLNRFPRFGARVIRALQREQIPHRVIGTNSLYVYEVGAGVVFLPDQLSTEDIDLLMDDRQGLKIATRLKKRTLLSLVKDTDKTFKRLSSSPNEFAAVTESGYRVEFVTQGGRDIMRPGEFAKLLQADDLRPIAIDSLKWYLASPQYSEVVFDEQGMPLRVETVDPRVFVLHKWYVSQQNDRRPVKRRRDEAQAKTVADVVVNELGHLPAAKAVGKLFPDSLIRDAPYDSDRFSI